VSEREDDAQAVQSGRSLLPSVHAHAADRSTRFSVQ
jgi:hypothetical protein